MKFKYTIVFLISVIMLGTAMITGGTVALFNDHEKVSSTLNAGTFNLITKAGGLCGESFTDSFDNVVPGQNLKSTTFTIKNDGTMDAWVGLQTVFSDKLNDGYSFQASYEVNVYDAEQVNDADVNGDKNSLCHSGELGKGAGGNDKPQLKLQRDNILTSDEIPQTPFQLAEGDYAFVTYVFNLLGTAKKELENQNGLVKMNIHGVQVDHNNLGDGPEGWGD